MPRPKQEQEKRKLTLELSLPVRERLTSLQQRSEADSLTEVIRRSLALYDLLLAARDNGEEIIIRSSAGEKKLALV